MGQPGTKESDGGHLLDEPDIGSGEPSPGQQETEDAVKKVPQPAPQEGAQPKQ